MTDFILSRFPLPSTQAEYGLDVVNRASSLAIFAHYGQTRKDGITPQIMHPLAVQGLLARTGIFDENIHAVALLHDSIEENPGARGQQVRAEIANTLGDEILSMVEALTDDDSVALSRAERKARQLERLSQAPWELQIIKLADVVASMQEGPAPSWTPEDVVQYVQQRSRLVDKVLRHSSAELAFYFSHTLNHPTWQTALKASPGVSGSPPALR